MATTNDTTPTSSSSAISSDASSISYDFIDTHTHIDTTMDRLGLTIDDYSTFRTNTLLPVVILDTNIDSSTNNNKKKKKAKKPQASPNDITSLNELNSNELGIIQCVYRGCVQVCAEPKSLEPTLLLLDRFQDIRAAFGIHPHNASEYSDEIELKLCDAQRHSSAVAWGEIGLDYHYNLSPPDVQRRVFERQMEMAVSLGKPVVIHSREAEEDTLELMRRHLPTDHLIHVHCFTSSVDMAQRLLSGWNNLFIGITGVVTFKTAQNVRDVAAILPLDRLLLETDAPFMAPLPFRGKVCHSAMIPHTALAIAAAKGVPVADVLTSARRNTRTMYGI